MGEQGALHVCVRIGRGVVCRVCGHVGGRGQDQKGSPEERAKQQSSLGRGWKAAVTLGREAPGGRVEQGAAEWGVRVGGDAAV
jgi:hypothetical protein